MESTLPPTVPAPQPRIDSPRYAVPPENTKQLFAGMKGNPVHVVVDEGVFPRYSMISFFRPRLKFTQMDQVCSLIRPYRLFRFLPRFNYGGDYRRFEIDASSWRNQIYPRWTAREIQ